MMIGIHVHKAKRKTMCEALEQDMETFDMYDGATQIFVMSSMSTKLVGLGNIDEIVKMMKKDNCKLVVHASHLTQGIWNPEKTERGWITLKTQLEITAKLNAYGFVLHLPKRSPDSVAKTMKRYANRINKILAVSKTKILLEHPTYKADLLTSYEMPEKLNRLTTYMKKTGLKHWGYCIDTAHIWSSVTLEDRTKGFKIETYAGMSKWLSKLDKKTRNRIRFIHLNGSRNPHSNNKDKHSIPMFDGDFMWTSYRKKNFKKSGLYRILKFAKSKNVILAIEKNRGSDADLIKSLNLIRKKMQ